MTPAALREKVKDGWDADKVEELIKCHQEKSDATNAYQADGARNQIVSTVLIDVYERYGYFPRHMIDDTVEVGTPEGDKEIFTLTITGFGPDSAKKHSKDDDTKCLYKVEWKSEMPIIDVHINKTYGRWKGVGVVELLFPIQQRMNEVANQKRISMELSALHLFQTADPGVLNNILTDLENGDIIQAKNPLTPIATEERNLPAFDSEIVTYSTQADKLSFANDLLSGGDIPSSTPATNVVTQNNNQVLVHLEDRENFTNFLADNYIKQFVVPKLIKDMSDEHFLRIVSTPDDLLQIEDMMVDIKLWDTVKKQAMEKGRVINILEAEDLREEMYKKLRAKGPNRYVKVLQGYYEKKIGDVIVIIGNEKKDLAKVANNTLSFFQMLQNPQVLDDPVMRMFATQYGREIGMDVAQMQMAYAKRDNQIAEQRANPRLPKPKPEEKEDPAIANVLWASN